MMFPRLGLAVRRRCHTCTRGRRLRRPAIRRASAPLHEHSCVAARHARVLDVAGVSDRLPAATPAARPIGPATSNPATPTAAVAA